MPSYASSPGLVVSFEDGVLRLMLDRTEKRNALDDTMIAALIDHLGHAQDDEGVRAIVLAGSGDHFCSGFDLIGRNAPRDSKPRAGAIQRRLPAQAHALLPLLLTTQVPVVSVVRGWAAGIGFHLALASDFCIAAASARFWEPFTARGFTPDSGGTWLLPRLIGIARAKDLLMLGRELSGEEAAEWGLIHRAVVDADVDAAADELVDELANAPTVALGLTKWLVHAGAGLSLEQHLANEAFALELSSRSDDFKEGMVAMREKRDPRFTGR